MNRSTTHTNDSQHKAEESIWKKRWEQFDEPPYRKEVEYEDDPPKQQE